MVSVKKSGVRSNAPRDWRLIPVSQMGRVLTGGTPSTLIEEYWDGDIPWITPTDIDLEKMLVSPERKLTEAGLKQVGELPAGAVLVTCIASIGKNALLESRGSCNQQINAIIPNKHVVSSEFLYYAFEFAGPKLRQMAGTTATAMVSKKTFLTFELLIPFDLAEQRKIADVLLHMHELIATLDRIIAKKRVMKQGAMQQLLTGRTRLPGFWNDQTQSTPGDKQNQAPKGWDMLTTSRLGTVITGGTPSTVVPEFWGGGIPWITPTDIDLDHRHVSAERTLSEVGIGRACDLPAGTVLVTCIASIGKNALLQSRGSCNQQINAIVPDTNVTTSEFLYYAMEFATPRLRQLAGTTATAMVSKKVFLTLEVQIPCDILEQKAIAQVLTDMDAEIDALVARREKTALIKTGMMQELLTGRTRLV